MTEKHIDYRKEKILQIIGNFKKNPVTITTDAGKQVSNLKGQIILFVRNNSQRTPTIVLKALNLTASSVECKKGKSGLLSMSLVPNSSKVSYRRGKFQIKSKINLHYPLINKIHGFKPEKKDKIENDDLIPYVDVVEGKITGEFEKPLDRSLIKRLDQNEKTSLKLKLEAKFHSEDYYISTIVLVTVIVVVVAFFSSQKFLKIQPVFIRSDPNDPNPTGWSFETLMQVAKCMWRKCCVTFTVLEPIYIDDASYKEIGSYDEAVNLSDEVDVDDAVEVFVADRMTRACYDNWGGGLTFSSGTANTKIVSCDSQLCVTDSTGVSLGAINYNHLAHELGHSLGLRHPTAAATATAVPATANTVMEPSGYLADNPHPQSQFNCDNVSNPLIKEYFVLYACRCISNPEI